MSRPILAVDVDGVISLFGFDEPPDRKLAQFELIDGMVHCISLVAGERLKRLAEVYDLVWATGWEEKANDYLPNILGLPELPHLSFDGAARFGSAHWKLGPLDEYGQGTGAGLDRRQLRRELLRVGTGTRRADPARPTEPHLGLEEVQVEALTAWANGL
jgi:hypothetical protein